MDVEDFIDAAQDYGFTDLSNATILRALQGSVDSIERLRPWPFLEEWDTMTFAGGSALPVTDLPRLRAVLRARDNTTQRKLSPIRLDDLEDTVYDYDLAGAPRYYYMLGGRLRVWPEPEAGRTVDVIYIQHSARLTETSVEADFLIPARHHEAVMFGMLRRLYDQQDDPELAATMAQQRDQMVVEMVEDLTKQQYDEPDLIWVTDSDF